MSEATLVVSALDLKIKKRDILKQINFSVQAGSVFAIIGHNGAGKTSLFHLILGLKFQTAGEIKISSTSSHDHLSRTKLGYVPERPYLQLEQTLKNFLGFHAGLIGLSGEKKAREVQRVAAEVNLETHLGQTLSTFSKGMLQKSLLAQASLGQPEIYLLDEPMSGLDPEARESVREQIARLKREKKTVLFSSHALEDVDQLADQVMTLKSGEIEFLGTVEAWRAQK